MKKIDFIFVSGCMRTGTTILQNCIGSHPGINVMGEAGFAELLRLASDCPDIQGSWTFLRNDGLFNSRRRQTYAGYNRIWGDTPRPKRLELARTIAYKIKELRGGKVLLDKQPNDILNLNWVKEVFGDTCLTILTQRRWESMLASWLNMVNDIRAKRTVTARAAYIKQLEKKVNPDIRIHYEEFVTDPVKTIQVVYQLAGLDIDLYDKEVLSEVHQESLDRYKECKQYYADHSNVLENLF